MSRILLLSYYFPPIGGAGAQRPLRFARHLTEAGHDVVVVTGSGETKTLWTPSDSTLEDEIPSEIEIVRVPGPEPGPTHPGDRYRRLLNRPRVWEPWWYEGAVEAGRRLGHVDVIHTVMSPYRSAEISHRLSRDLHCGWIADLGDPWAFDEMNVFLTAWHRSREVARMRRMLGTAAAIIMSTPGAARQVVDEFPELADRPVVAIPNGYERDDFNDPPAPTGRSDAFRIVHTGYLHTDLGLQQKNRSRLRRLAHAEMPRVDILTRSHVFLLEALSRLLERDPALADRIELHLAGVLSPTDRRLAEELPVSVLHGYLTHAESLDLIRSANLLFLPLQNVGPGCRSTTVPGKTYEYIASGRPILAAVPAGDARDIVTRSGRGRVCDPDDVDAMVAAIEAELRSPTGAGDTQYAARFAYDALVQDVLDVIEQVLGESNSRHAPAAAR